MLNYSIELASIIFQSRSFIGCVMDRQIRLYLSRLSLIKLLEGLHLYLGNQLRTLFTQMLNASLFYSLFPSNKKWVWLTRKVLFLTQWTLDQHLELVLILRFAIMGMYRKLHILNFLIPMRTADIKKATNIQLLCLLGKRMETIFCWSSGKCGRCIWID